MLTVNLWHIKKGRVSSGPGCGSVALVVLVLSEAGRMLMTGSTQATRTHFMHDESSVDCINLQRHNYLSKPSV